MGGQLREFGPGELEAMPAGEDNGHGATQGRRGLVAAKIDLDEAVFVLAVPSPVGIECGDRQAVRGAELNPRLRAVFIMPEQLLNLRRRAALPVLGLLHPFSKPDPSLTGNQGVTHTLTFHKVLKSGCRAEQSHLRTAERLTNLFAIFCIIAWRVFWLTMNQREDKEASPSLVFTETEQKVLDHFVKDSPSESRSFTLQYYLRKVAKLGGYLARKNDSPPGNMVIWRGLRKLNDLHAGFLAAGQIVGN